MFVDIIPQNECGFNHTKEEEQQQPQTKLRNERAMMCASAQLEAEQPEEQHHNTQHAPHTQF
jgi:hypothetical protein